MPHKDPEAKRVYFREYQRKRRLDPAFREYQNEAVKRSNARYPEKVKARNKLNTEVRAGRIVRQPCEVCGSSEVEAHHDDYSRPLDVRWRCQVHHEEIHHA